MSTRILITVLMLGCLAPGILAQDDRREFGDPIIKLDGSYEMTIDLSVIVADMLPLVLEAVAEDDSASAAWMEQVADLAGLDALRRMELKIEQSSDRMREEFVITFDPDRREALLPRLLAAPNGDCEFARYLEREDVAMFATDQGLKHGLEAVLDLLTSPAMAEFTGDLPVDEAGDIDLGFFAPRRDLLPLLTGEVSAFFLAPPEGGQPMIDPETGSVSIPYFLAIGSTDGFALRDLILELMSMLGGDAGGELAAMLDATEAEMVGDFELHELPFGGAVATSRDFLVIGMAADQMRRVLAEADGDLDVPRGIQWVYFDGPRYLALMDSITEMAAAAAPTGVEESMWYMDIYDVIFEHLDFEEILVRSRDDGVEGEVLVEGRYTTGLYRAVPAMLEALPRVLEQDDGADGDDYMDAIIMLDAGMTEYAFDHDGVYPEQPFQLFEEGYVDAWPFAGATPAGQHEDWHYTYHVYRDAAGVVDGYLFVLYMDDPDAGFDIYTAENLAADGPFVMDRDGEADGVFSYCYDGTAIPMVKAYKEQ